MPPSKSPWRRRGRDHLVDDAPRYHVAQRTLDAVSDFDAHGAVVLGHQEQRAVVHLATAELPLLYHPQGVLLDGFGPRRADHQHGDLHALALLEGPKLRIQRGDTIGGERSREIGDARLQRRNGDQLLRGRDRKEQAQQQPGQSVGQPKRGRRREHHCSGRSHVRGAPPAPRRRNRPVAAPPWPSRRRP
jgi:hypothetical protein